MRIEGEVVREAVVVVVVFDPPAAADTHEKADAKAEDIVSPGAGKDLAVAGVVTDKADLGKEEAGEYAGCQLQPNGLGKHEDRDCRGIHREIEQDLRCEEGRLALEDAALGEDAFEVGVVVLGRGPVGGWTRRN